jgi:dTDP-4-amino-4,6-dideoxygalactose transaminase
VTASSWTGPHDAWAEVDDSVRAAVSRAMEGRSGTGFDEEAVAAAECELSVRLGYPYVLLTSSGTAAAHAVFMHCARAGMRSATLPVHVYPAIAGAATTAGLAPRFTGVDENLVVTPPAVRGAAEVDVIHLPWGDVTGALGRVSRQPGGVTVLDVSHATPRIPADIWRDMLYGVGSLGPGKFLSGMELGFVATGTTGNLRAIAALGATRRHRSFDVDPPIAMKLRPHPLAVAILGAQLARLREKLDAHDETWGYLAPRLQDIDGLRVVTTSAPQERIFWRCMLEIRDLDGTPGRVRTLVASLRDRGVPVHLPEYLDDAVSLVGRQTLAASEPCDLAPMPWRYMCLPGFVRLGRADCDRLLRELAAGLRAFTPAGS